jgi:hypothetical protein
LGQESGSDKQEVSKVLAEREKKFQAATGLAVRRVYNDGLVRKNFSS